MSPLLPKENKIPNNISRMLSLPYTDYMLSLSIFSSSFLVTDPVKTEEPNRALRIMRMKSVLEDPKIGTNPKKTVPVLIRTYYNY
jgi:hypothetical protein